MSARYLDLLRAIYAGRFPVWYGRMQTPGSPAKYLTVHHPLTARLGAAHWDGRLTLAAPLLDGDGQAQAAAADLDHGGRVAIQAWLHAARGSGWVAWGIAAKGANDHDGGHVWLLFDQPCAPDRLRALIGSIGEQAGHSTAERYPSRKALRLPFGLHTTTRQRGCLLTQDGQEYTLDHPQERRAAFARVMALPRNRAAAVPALPPPSPAETRSQRTGATGETAASVIARYNLTTDLIHLLEQYGGRVAARWPNGAVVHCPCRGHHRRDEHPSLHIKAATTARYGDWVAFGYSPNCQFYTEPGQVVSTFDVYCYFEGFTVTEAVRQLAGRHGYTPAVLVTSGG